MSEPQNFRSAFNGFHREDVVNHIAYMTTKHETVASQLRSEVEALRSEITDLQDEIQAREAEENLVPELEQTIAAQEAELENLRRQLAEAGETAAKQAVELASLREQLEEAREAAKPVAIEKSATHWDELRAYRRAETAERRAREHVNELYDHATASLRGAVVTLGDTSAAIDSLVEKFRSDLVELMDAIQTGGNALTAAAETLDSLRPEEIE